MSFSRSHDSTDEAKRCANGQLVRSRVLCVDNDNHVRERRVALLVERLPRRLQSVVRWLRRPEARWVRIPAGLLLILGGVFSILPILGLWMLPLGLMLLAEDVRSLRRGADRALLWIERNHPDWMGSRSEGAR